MKSRSFINLILLSGLATFWLSKTSFARETCTKSPFVYCKPVNKAEINVHLISHSHLDMGWTRTIEECYESSISSAKAVIELNLNPNRTFAFAEAGFLWMWWKQQTEQTKANVRSLIDQGRLELVMGSWQMDTFGHSREHASLAYKIGFDALFLGRLNEVDFIKRKSEKRLEFLWSSNDDLHNEKLFTSIFPHVYRSPHGFCWHRHCQDVDITETPEEKLDQRMQKFAQIVYQVADMYESNHVVLTFGDDFTHYDADRWYNNLDKIVKHMERRREKFSNQFQRPKINVFYSTPNCYAQALSRHSNTSWRVESPDFFPYLDMRGYWTGFYTSRSALKFNVRQAGSFLRASRQLSAFATLTSNASLEPLETLERIMAAMQHHDAITGTERLRVAQDYAMKMSIGVEKTASVVEKALNKLVDKSLSEKEFKIFYCPLLNQSECAATETGNSFNMVVYNPMARRVRWWANLPVTSRQFKVVDLENKTLVNSQVMPIYSELRLIEDRKSNANNRLIFGLDLPPMGFKVLRIEKKSDARIKKQKQKGFQIDINLSKFKNKHLELKFDSMGNLAEVHNLDDAIESKVKQSFCFYTAFSADKTKSLTKQQKSLTPSGSYLFQPDSSVPLQCFFVKNFTVVRTEQLIEVHQVFNPWISQTIRLRNDSKHAEFEWQVGPIDVADNLGKEVVMKFTSDLKSGDFFYTDSNGRQTIQRNSSLRNKSNPIASIYYPLTSTIFIRDEEKIENRRQLTLVTDRSQGGSSLESGTVEIMLHRRLLVDDRLGINEPLNEQGPNKKGLVVNGVVSMFFCDVAQSARVYRPLALELNNRPLVTFSKDVDYDRLGRLSKLNVMSGQLPSNLHLLTLALENDRKNWSWRTLLIRIEHFFNIGEDENLSQPVSVDFEELFRGVIEVSNVEELGLAANMGVEEMNQMLTWKSKDGRLWPKREENVDGPGKFEFSFKPMQIRTFRVFF